MKRNQWIRLAVFLISFAVFLMLPLRQYWMLKYTKGCDIVIPAILQRDEDPSCLAFLCEEATVAAKENATDLGCGYVYFDLSGKTARLAGVVADRKAVPEDAPYLPMRNLKLTPDGKRYIVPLIFRYFADNPAEAANLRMEISKAQTICITVTIYPDGKAQVKDIDAK